MSIPTDSRVARDDHQRAVAEFLAVARAVPAAQWGLKRNATQWSPEQIAEHVRMTYEVVGAQFSGGPGLRVRTPWWLRPILRWKYLKGLLNSGIFPSGARAPREIRPGDGPFDRETILAALERAAKDVEQRFVLGWSQPSSVMTHHVFGTLSHAEGVRLVTVHTAHHARQLRSVIAEASTSADVDAIR